MMIGQVAARFGLDTPVLRFWESIGLLAPARTENGRRHYRQDHVARVAMILRGKEAGFSLRQLRQMLDAPDPAARRTLLEHHRADLDRRIAQIQASKETIEHALDCPAEDFTQCPSFQQMMQTTPPHAAPAPRPHEAVAAPRTG